jgi:hypothetical protein
MIFYFAVFRGGTMGYRVGRKIVGVGSDHEKVSPIRWFGRASGIIIWSAISTRNRVEREHRKKSVGFESNSVSSSCS